jgi:hypothetical protein
MSAMFLALFVLIRVVWAIVSIQQMIELDLVLADLVSREQRPDRTKHGFGPSQMLPRIALNDQYMKIGFHYREQRKA